jgi:hypothetical protein
MAADRFFEFNTVPECKAFMEGVRYVNDSAIMILGIYSVPGKGNRRVIDSKLYVWLADIDKSARESHKDPPRWKSRQEVDADA